MARHNDIGKWGEELARDTLIANGYGIVESNWCSGKLELDIIATKGNRIVFVEVKTRTSAAVDPLLAIDSRRINHLVRAAQSYIASHDIKHDYQFDIITIIGSPESSEPPIIEHVADAFLPPLRTY